MQKKSIIAASLGALVLVGGLTWAVAPQAQSKMHQMMSDHHKGGGHMQHDEMRMPMLNGRDTTANEVDELRAMFVNHTDLTRTVTNLPNGIRTVTETEDDDLRAALVSHVVGMIARVEEKRDPQIPIQSQTLDMFFANPEKIVTEIEMTDTGIAVVQTSDDPEMVAQLQIHAAEVSDMAERGMQAVHENMMRRH